MNATEETTQVPCSLSLSVLSSAARLCNVDRQRTGGIQSCLRIRRSPSCETKVGAELSLAAEALTGKDNRHGRVGMIARMRSDTAGREAEQGVSADAAGIPVFRTSTSTKPALLLFIRPGLDYSSLPPSHVSGPGFEDEVHRRLGRPAEVREPGVFKHLPQPGLAGLGAEGQPH